MLIISPFEFSKIDITKKEPIHKVKPEENKEDLEQLKVEETEEEKLEKFEKLKNFNKKRINLYD